MAVEVVMPRLGWTATEGVLKEWLMPSGASVKPGDVLFAVEGDKAVEEIESLDGGILHIPPDAPQPGDAVPVGQLLAYILEDGEEPPAGPLDRASTQEVATQADIPALRAVSTVADRSSADHVRPAISPRARKTALELGVDWTGLQGSGRTGRIVERDIRAAAADHTSGILSISPVARRLARELGVGMDVLAKAFPNVRITVDMVQQLGAAAKPQEDAIPFTPTRRTIAANLTQSLARSAPVTLTTELNATELVRRLRDTALQRIAREGYAGTPVLEPTVEMRYSGQNYGTSVVLSLTDWAFGPENLVETIDRFESEHRRLYGYDIPGEIVELVLFTMTAVGVNDDPGLAPLPPGGSASPIDERPVYFREAGWAPTRIYRREQLPPGAELVGPAVIEEAMSTTLVHPGERVHVDDYGNLLIHVAPT